LAKRRARGDGSVYWDAERGRWVAQITLPNGRRRSKTGSRQKDVLGWLTEQRRAVQHNTYVVDERLSLGDFLDRYLNDVARHNVRPKTFATYVGYVNNHIKPELGRVRLSSLRPDQVQVFYNKKLEAGLSPRTVEQMHAILHKSLKQAMRWGLVSRNVTDLVDAPRPKRMPPTGWSGSEVNAFLKAAESHAYYPIYVLAVTTGMRQSELLGVHREDVSLSRAVISVRHTVQRIPGRGLMVVPVKSDKSKRSVALPSMALAALKQHLGGVESGLIFTTSRGTPVDARELVRHFKATIEQAGLPDIRFHDLRHFHASALLQAGVNPKVVQERLGHSTAAFTLDVYSHVIPSLQRDAAEKIEDIIGM
jgi:integrase